MQRWRTAAVATVLVGFTGTAGAADLPVTVRESATANQQSGAIDAYVKGQIARIQSGQGAGAARDELGRQCDANQAVTPSASFQSTYVTSVIANINPLLADTTEKGLAKRLNAAIIVGRLCKSTKLIQLAPLAQKLMEDKSSAVALWGIKGGAELVPAILGVEFNRRRQTMTASIVASVKSHAEAGPLVQTAYDALYLPQQSPALPAEAYKICIEAMNEILEIRTRQYAAGVPSSPQAERVAPVFFVLAPSRDVLASDAALRLRTVQNLMNIMSLAAQHTATAPGGEARVQVIGLVTAYAGTLKVFFENTLTQPVVASKFNPITRTRDPVNTAAVVKQIGEALTAVRGLPDFKAIQDAPQVQSGN